MAHENTAKYLEGNAPKKVIVVLGKIVNVVAVLFKIDDLYN
jgi:leucyl-tRNA synthetase